MSEMQLGALLAARLPRVKVDAVRLDGDVEIVRLPPSSLVAVGRFLSSDADAAYDLIDITAIDRLGRENGGARFVIVVLLCSRTHRSRARLEVQVDDDLGAWPSLSAVWPAAALYEREIADLFGLHPDGHPNPRRLVLPESFVGHPLRLDYRLTKHQPQVVPPERGPLVTVDVDESRS
jgi:NADH:ubiquinone oxidoreductase subunit C